VAAFALVLAVLGMSAGEAHAASGWRWPVDGRVITAFSNDRANPYAGGVHRGIDIAASAGTPVVAAHAGEVTYSGALGYSGLTVAVRTADGFVTSYLHLGAVSVRRGESLDAGGQVGEVGTTGRRSKPEPHLHFGVRAANDENGYVDPLSLLPPLPGPSEGAPPAPVPATVPALPRPAPVAVAPRRAHERVVVPRAPRPLGVAVHPPVAVAPPVAVHRAAPRRATSVRAHPAPVAPGLRHAPREEPVRARPARAPAAQRPARDWGRPLALAGIAVALLALFGARLVGQATRIREIGHDRRKRARWRGILRGAT
jgi:hypothetical protein